MYIIPSPVYVKQSPETMVEDGDETIYVGP
jgi:hypothetical protein